jgi:hypothetical protein
MMRHGTPKRVAQTARLLAKDLSSRGQAGWRLSAGPGAAESGELSEGIDPEPEAAGLFYLVQGLIGPVLIGQLTPHQAVEILDHQLNRIFR